MSRTLQNVTDYVSRVSYPFVRVTPMTQTFLAHLLRPWVVGSSATQGTPCSRSACRFHRCRCTVIDIFVISLSSSSFLALPFRYLCFIIVFVVVARRLRRRRRLSSSSSSSSSPSLFLSRRVVVPLGLPSSWLLRVTVVVLSSPSSPSCCCRGRRSLGVVPIN